MSWEDGISTATRERCGVCQRPSPVGFHVPDEIWLRVVPDYYRQTVLCIMCFASFGDERMIAWEEGITFYPVSFRTHREHVERMIDERADEMARRIEWEELTPSQQAWVYAKGGWEHASIVAVLAEYEIPTPEHLNNDGTARRCEDCRDDRAAWDHSAIRENFTGGGE